MCKSLKRIKNIINNLTFILSARDDVKDFIFGKLYMYT